MSYGGAWDKYKKSPEPSWLQGRIVDPRYHPAYLPVGEIPSDSSKSYPGNGGNRVPLLKTFVHGTDSGTRPPNPPHRLAPNADSLEHWDREDFSFNVFVMYTSDIKAQTRPFVNRLRVKMYTYIHHEIGFHFVKQ